jgi:hypothetical protein
MQNPARVNALRRYRSLKALKFCCFYRHLGGFSSVLNRQRRLPDYGMIVRVTTCG